MLCLLLLCLFIGSCHSQFDVSVTVLDPFCLNYYYDDDVIDIDPQLQLEFDVVYGDKRSNSYFFQTDFDDNYPPSHFKFVKGDNIISPFFNPLVLGSPIPLPAVSPDDNLEIRFDINPVYKRAGEIKKKCSSDERLHNHTVVPRSILHSEARHNVTSQLTIDLSKTPCLTSTESWFHDQTAQIKVQVDFDCHGPCKDLFTTTTSTTTTTTSIIQTTTEVTTQSQTQDSGDSNKLIIPLLIALVVSGVEFVLILGYCIQLRYKARTNSQMHRKRKIEPSIYYDTARPNNTQVQDTETTGNYAEADDDDYAQYAREVIISQPLRNGPSN